MDEWICKGLVCLFGYESKRAGAHAGEHICMQKTAGIQYKVKIQTNFCKIWSVVGSTGSEHMVVPSMAGV